MPISVPSKFAAYLRTAVNDLNDYLSKRPLHTIAAGISIQEAYNYVKNHLSNNGVTPTQHKSTSTVPDDHVHWDPNSKG